MGQQQLLLIILGVILVGIAIAVGIGLFGASSTQSNKDGVTAGLINVAADAYQFKVRPTSLGGGSNRYNGGGGYAIPSKLKADDNGTYVAGTVGANTVTILGTSSINTLWVATCTEDDTGKTTIDYGSGW